MIKKIIAVLLIVCIAVTTTVIGYWKDNQFDPDSSDLLVYLLVLPVLITTMLLTPWLIYRFYQARKQPQNQTLAKADTACSEGSPVEIQWLRLQIYSAFSKSALGENDDIIQAIRNYQSPQLDMQLVNGYGLPILSYRLPELDEYLREDVARSSSISVRQQRITILIQQQLEQQAAYLHQIADHLRRSSLFFETEHLHPYRMHPAWLDPQAEYDPAEISSTARLDSVSRLNRFNLHIILSEDLLHVWDEIGYTGLLYDWLGELGFLLPKVHVEYHFWGQDSASVEWLNLLQQLAQQPEQIALIIHADSEIDQELVDERTWFTKHYVPAEFAGSCCVSALNVAVEGISPVKQLCMTLNQPRLVTVLKELGLQELPQYEQEQPFVIVLENAAEVKVSKQLARLFEQTPIEAHHYLYPSFSLGHSQQLARVYGYGLAMQFPEDQTVFIAVANPVVIQSARSLVDEQAAA